MRCLYTRDVVLIKETLENFYGPLVKPNRAKSPSVAGFLSQCTLFENYLIST